MSTVTDSKPRTNHTDEIAERDARYWDEYWGAQWRPVCRKLYGYGAQTRECDNVDA